MSRSAVTKCKKDVGNYTIKVTPIPGYTWAGELDDETVSFSWNITRAGNIHVNVENLTAYVDDTTLPQHKYTITGLLGEDQKQASVIFAYHRIIDAAGNAEQKESVPDLTREGKYRIDVSRLTIAKADYTQNYTSLNYTAGELEIVKKDIHSIRQLRRRLCRAVHRCQDERQRRQQGNVIAIYRTE